RSSRVPNRKPAPSRHGWGPRPASASANPTGSTSTAPASWPARRWRPSVRGASRWQPHSRACPRCDGRGDMMPRLQKNTLALTFKFDCDRYLRFRLASDAERKAHGFDAEAFKRPGIELIQAAGRRWETDKYQDLVDAGGAANVAHRVDAE